MPHRSPARFLAPLAVLAVSGAVYLVVNSGLQSDAGSPSATVQTTTTTSAHPRHHKKTYTVRSGDTLSAIAERFGISVEHLQQLNPSVDPNALHTGQKLKLRATS